jgi:site-specific recombinase XerD
MDEIVELAQVAIEFDVKWEAGRMLEVHTSSAVVNHFLDYIKMTRAYHTWVNYTHDLKLFFAAVGKEPATVTRQDCLEFMQQQVEAGYTNATINRHLAAVSSLFNELHLLEPERYPRNPVSPRPPAPSRPRQSLYRQQAQRLPEIIPLEALRVFLHSLPTWRDRTLVLLMWLSCLRISEAVGIRFRDIECSRRSLQIPNGKGNLARVVFMDTSTFVAFNRYLDEERQTLFPEVDHVFVAFKGKARGRPLSMNAVQKMLRYYSERTRLSHLHSHLFRHTGITQLVEQGMPEPAIRQFVGHRRAESLLPYLHLSDDFVAEEFAQAQTGLEYINWPAEEGTL